MTDTAAAPADPSEPVVPPGVAPTAAPIPLQQGVGVFLALLLLTIVSVLPALRGAFVWGDDAAITANPLMKNLDGLQVIWAGPMQDKLVHYPLPTYSPLSYTLYWMEYRIWGLNPTGYHVVSALLHLAAGMMVWLILRRLGVPLAWVAAAIVVAHPVNVQPVAWVAQRPIVLSALLGLISFYLLLRALGVVVVPERERPLLPTTPGRLYLIGVAFFVLALFAHATAAVMPVALGLVLWWKRGTMTRDERNRILPLLGLGAAAALLTVAIQALAGGANGAQYDWGSSAASRLPVRLQISGVAFWHALAKLMVPFPTKIDYGRAPLTALNFVGVAVAIAAMAGLWAARVRIGRGPFVLLACFAVLLFPAMGFADLTGFRYSLVADRWRYLASIPFAAGVTAFVVLLFGRRSLTAPIVGGAVAAGLAALSFFQARAYSGPDAFFADAIDKTPHSYMARYAMAERDLEVGAYAAARERLKIILEDVRPDDLASLWMLAEIDRLSGDLAASESALARLAARYMTDPADGSPRPVADDAALARVFHSGGLIALARGDDDAAGNAFKRALSIDPRDAESRIQAGRLLVKRATTTTDVDQRVAFARDAVTWFEEALALQPNSADVRVAYGSAMLELRQFQSAAEQFNVALRLEPGRPDVPVQLGRIFAESQNEFDSAEAMFARVLEKHPGYPDALLARAQLRLKQNRPADAIVDLEAALASRPDYVEASNLLISVYNAEGKLDAAAALLEGRLARRPKALELILPLADLRARQGKVAETERLLLRALEIDPRQPRPLFEMARLRDRQGRYDEAIAFLELFTRIRPDVEEAKEFRKLIEQHRANGDPSTQPGAARPTTAPTTAPSGVGT